MIDRDAEIERAARAIDPVAFDNPAMFGMARAEAIELATAAITPLLDRIEELERELICLRARKFVAATIGDQTPVKGDDAIAQRITP